MAKTIMKIEGMDELDRNIKQLEKATGKKETGEVLVKQAYVIRDRIKDRAPVGPTGNLKRSPVARLMPESSSYPAVAIAGIDRKIAPHAHLIEFGTSRAPAHPFFRPAIDESMPKVIDGIKDGLKKNIEDAL